MSNSRKIVGVYNGIQYSIDHLMDAKKIFKSPDGKNEYHATISYHFHCFTDHINHSGDNRTPFVDPEFADEQRVFCPNRWWLSLNLPRIVDQIGDKRLIDVGGAQWLYNYRFFTINYPYSIFFKFNPGSSETGILVRVTSAYIKNDAPSSGKEHRFDYLLKLAKSGNIPGK